MVIWWYTCGTGGVGSWRLRMVLTGHDVKEHESNHLIVLIVRRGKKSHPRWVLPSAADTHSRTICHC